MSENPTQPNTSPRGLEFGIANFKAFGPELQSIKLRPLTLIFGANSVGKSSLLHALLWAKDVLTTSDPDVRKPSVGQGQVDLGGFEQIQFQGKNRGDVAFRIARFTKSAGLDSHDYDVTFHYGTEAAMPNLWRTAARMLSDSIREAKQAGLSDMEAAAKLALNFHAAWMPYHFLQQHPGFEHLGFDWYFGWNPMRQKSSPYKKKSWKYQHLARWVYPTITRIWIRHSDLAREIKELPPYKYFAKIREMDHSALLPTIQKTGATLDQIEAEIAAFSLLISRAICFDRRPDKLMAKPRLTGISIQRQGNHLLRARLMDDDLFWLTYVDPSILPDNCPLRLAKRRAHSFLRLDVKDGKPVGLVFDEQTYAVFTKGFPKMGDSSIDPNEWLPALNQSLRECGCFETDVSIIYPNLEYVGPLRGIPGRSDGGVASGGSDSTLSSGVWTQVLKFPTQREQLNRWMSEERLNLGYEIEVDHTVELGAVQTVLSEHLQNEILRIRERTNDSELMMWKSIRWKHPKVDPIGRAKKDWGGHARFEEKDYETLDHTPVVRRSMESLAARLATAANAVIRLRDLKTGARVALQDIGVGISQILPLVIRSVVDEDTLIAIEQPEIHAHPALQAELGDLFIESALKRRNTLLLETHSEHLILRILRRVREATEGVLGADQVRITPGDVSVLYVKPGAEGSEIIELPVTPEGDFAVPWPDGFFPERAKELF